MRGCRRYGGRRRGVFNDDYLADTAFVVDLLHFAVADGVLVGPFALAGDDGGSGHDGGIWARLGEWWRVILV